MSFDSIITILGLLLAGWAIMPDSKRLIFQLRITFVDKVIYGLFFILIIYLLYYDSFKIGNYVPHLGFYRIGITHSNIIFILLLLFGISSYFRFTYIKYFSSGKIKDFGKLVDNLLQEKKYNDLIHILDESFDKICIHAYGKNYTEHKIDWNKKLTKDEEDSREIIRRIILSEPFIEHIVHSQSYSFMKFFDIIQFVYQFKDILFRHLLKYKQSILYSELDSIRYIDKNREYYIPSRNKLLLFLYNDIQNTTDLEIWKPLFDFALYDLKERAINNIHHVHVYSDDHYTPKYSLYSDTEVVMEIYNILIIQSLKKNVDMFEMIMYYDILLSVIFTNHSLSISQNVYEGKGVLINAYEAYIRRIFFNIEKWLDIIKNHNYQYDKFDFDELKEKQLSLTLVVSIIRSNIMYLSKTSSLTKKFISERLHIIMYEYVLSFYLQNGFYRDILWHILFDYNPEDININVYCNTLIDIIENEYSETRKTPYQKEYNHIIEESKKLLNKYKNEK
jgi:hypothetical protein